MAKSKIATAYVQVMPSMEGVAPKVSSYFGGAGKSSGASFGSNLIGTLKTALVSAGIGKALKATIMEGADLEQLRGGAEKIFDAIDTSQILNDAANAYKNLNMSANEYLATINDVGATFSATMGDEKGYAAAKAGLQAISDYASGTGKSVSALSEKFTMITRSTSSYQTIADQFSGILPATSADFLKQAQAAGFLSSQYSQLTQVPVAEYQEAVSEMLKKGVDDLNLTGNTAAETTSTISGSFAAMKSSLSNVLGNLALGEDMRPSLEALASTTKIFLLDNLVPTVGNIFTALPGSISTLLHELIPDNVQGVVNTAINGFTTFVTQNMPKVMDSGIETLTNLIVGIDQTIPTLSGSASKILDSLKSYLTDSVNLEKLLSAGGSLLKTISVGLINMIGDLATTAVEVLGALGRYLTDPANLSALLSKAGEIGAAIASAIWDNLVSVFNSLKTNFPSLVDGISVGMGFASTGTVSIPGFATGLDYVPYDNFLARLHEGEMVLTKSQANALRGGAVAGRRVTVNQYIYSEAKSAADLMDEARYKQEEAELLGI
ncbi:MAG: hypothetical protein IKT52_13730 [Oscillospiraceae bacterium]|nr:hypothetical protein [Oscillospiraceae bacterium]